MMELAQRLQIDADVVEHAIHLFRMCATSTSVRHRSIDPLATASMVAACRALKKPRSLQDACVATGTSERDAARYLKLVCAALDADAVGGDGSMDKDTIALHMARVMPKFCQLLQLPPSVEHIATHMAEVIVERNYCNRRNPMSISAAAIYLACQLEDSRKTQTEICHVTGLTEVTLRKVYKEVLRELPTILPPGYQPTVAPDRAFPTGGGGGARGMGQARARKVSDVSTPGGATFDQLLRAGGALDLDACARSGMRQGKAPMQSGSADEGDGSGHAQGNGMGQVFVQGSGMGGREGYGLYPQQQPPPQRTILGSGPAGRGPVVFYGSSRMPIAPGAVGERLRLQGGEAGGKPQLASVLGCEGYGGASAGMGGSMAYGGGYGAPQMAQQQQQQPGGLVQRTLVAFRPRAGVMGSYVPMGGQSYDGPDSFERRGSCDPMSHPSSPMRRSADGRIALGSPLLRSQDAREVPGMGGMGQVGMGYGSGSCGGMGGSFLQQQQQQQRADPLLLSPGGGGGVSYAAAMQTAGGGAALAHEHEQRGRRQAAGHAPGEVLMSSYQNPSVRVRAPQQSSAGQMGGMGMGQMGGQLSMGVQMGGPSTSLGMGQMMGSQQPQQWAQQPTSQGGSYGQSMSGGSGGMSSMQTQSQQQQMGMGGQPTKQPHQQQQWGAQQQAAQGGAYGQSSMGGIMPYAQQASAQQAPAQQAQQQQQQMMGFGPSSQQGARYVYQQGPSAQQYSQQPYYAMQNPMQGQATQPQQMMQQGGGGRMGMYASALPPQGGMQQQQQQRPHSGPPGYYQ
ncbi:hypothetical protein T492DRAFT_1143530 [Pavlovales sp. CCMP2436]|nr:hypothetical protein T492DRAFT_1143530 [Pavlovales sp. CCMP2436]